jgi:hypothetical protein
MFHNEIEESCLEFLAHEIHTVTYVGKLVEGERDLCSYGDFGVRTTDFPSNL